MTITSFIIYRYSLPLVRALKFKDIEIASREGFLVCLTGDNCRTGWGEAAPLPAFSNESLPQVLTILRSWTEASNAGWDRTTCHRRADSLSNPQSST
jgi:O-succinylbenzoate synthase